MFGEKPRAQKKNPMGKGVHDNANLHNNLALGPSLNIIIIPFLQHDSYLSGVLVVECSFFWNQRNLKKEREEGGGFYF